VTKRAKERKVYFNKCNTNEVKQHHFKSGVEDDTSKLFHIVIEIYDVKIGIFNIKWTEKCILRMLRSKPLTKKCLTH